MTGENSTGDQRPRGPGHASRKKKVAVGTETIVATPDPLGLVGTTIGDGFRVLAVAKHGGTSLVYRLQNPDDASSLAYRVYLGIGELDEDKRPAFIENTNEINRIIGYLATKTSGMVRVLGVGTQPLPIGIDVPCALTEWIDGLSLETVLDRERGLFSRSAAEAYDLMEDAIEALALAHEYGIVHRDIKPGSFFVAGDQFEPGSAKLLDFGLGKRKNEIAATVNVLTPDYAAPEQFAGEQDAIGPETDVFGLALVLVEVMLAGRPALEGDDFDALRRASENVAQRPTPRYFGLETPNAVEAIFKRALEVAPRDRFRDARAFSSALKAAIESDGRVTSSRISRVAGVLEVNTPSSEELSLRKQGDAQLTFVRGDTQVADLSDFLVATGGTIIAPVDPTMKFEPLHDHTVDLDEFEVTPTGTVIAPAPTRHQSERGTASIKRRSSPPPPPDGKTRRYTLEDLPPPPPGVFKDSVPSDGLTHKYPLLRTPPPPDGLTRKYSFINPDPATSDEDADEEPSNEKKKPRS